MKVKNLPSPRTGQPVANQFEIDTWENDTHVYYFQSYETVIAKTFFDRDVGKRRIQLDESMWDCSTTTSRYRNIFLHMTTAEIKQGIKTGSIELVNLN